MKIRNGFVSNSSSSSFVVVFPKKPKNSEEVKEYMFEKEKKTLCFCDFSDSVDNVAKAVFNDIKSKSISKKTIIERFKYGYRYHYDVKEKSFYGEREPYFGNDKETMSKIIKLEMEYDKKQKIFWEKYHKIEDKLKSIIGKEPDYHKKLEELKEKDTEWIELNKNRFNLEYFNKIEKLRQKCEMADVEKIIKDNKGKYICDFEYSDKDGQFYSLMEHGDIFYNLIHLRFSHH